MVKTCPICNGAFKDESLKKNRQFCSKTCLNKHQNKLRREHSVTEKICICCGKPYMQITSRQKYCSETCGDKHYKIIHKEEILLKGREYHKKNKYIEKIYREKNKEHMKEKAKKYYQANKARCLASSKKYRQIRTKEDPLFSFAYQTRHLVSQSFRRKGVKKSSRTEQILGCSIKEFKDYIEKQLPIGKTIKDMGYYGYHIDHIIPLATAKTKEEIVKLCHYTNLQPLWWEDNFLKKDKIYVS